MTISRVMVTSHANLTIISLLVVIMLIGSTIAVVVLMYIIVLC